MKANELQIGDWVNWCDAYYHGTGDKEPEQFTRDSFIDLLCRNTSSDDIELGCEYEPIPLTEDILKANGFVNDWKQLELEYIDKGNGWFLVDVEAESIEDGVVTKLCRYVHEVQHALRICKRNELADNFKLGTTKE